MEVKKKKKRKQETLWHLRVYDLWPWGVILTFHQGQERWCHYMSLGILFTCRAGQTDTQTHKHRQTAMKILPPPRNRGGGKKKKKKPTFSTYQYLKIVIITPVKIKNLYTVFNKYDYEFFQTSNAESISNIFCFYHWII